MIPQASSEKKYIFLKALSILSQSSVAIDRQEAERWLQNFRQTDIYGTVKLSIQTLKDSYAHQQSIYETKDNRNRNIEQLLVICFLKDMILSGQTVGMQQLSQQFYELYMSFSRNKDIADRLLECMDLFFNAYGNKRIKNQYLKKSVQYLSLNYPNNLEPTMLEIIAKIFGSPRQKNQIATAVGEFPHAIQKFIRVYIYEKLPQNIPQRLWHKIILGLVNFSTLTPPFRFIINGIRSQNQQNLHNIDLDVYLSFLRLYIRGRHKNDVADLQIVSANSEIFQGILIKISLGIIQKIFDEHFQVEAVQLLIEALNISFSDCLVGANQNKLIQKFLEQRNILNFQYFQNLAILLTNIVTLSSENSIEQISFNSTIKTSIANIINSLLNYQINGQTATWVQGYYTHFGLDGHENKKNIFYFFTLLPRSSLQMMGATNFLNSELYECSNNFDCILQDENRLGDLISFMDFAEHYINLYQYLESNQIRFAFQLFFQRIICFDIPLDIPNKTKICYLKCCGINNLCKLQKYYPNRDQKQLSNKFSLIMQASLGVVSIYADNRQKNCSLAVDKIMQGLVSLTKILQYSEVVYFTSIERVYSIFLQLSTICSEERKQILVYFANELLSLVRIVLTPKHLDSTLISILDYFFKYIWHSKYRFGLEQQIFQLIYKILYEINHQVNVLEDMSIDNNALIPYFYQLSTNIGILDIIITPDLLLEADKNILILYVRIILEFLIHQQFISEIKTRLLSVYNYGKNKQEFSDIFCVTNIIWEAAFILYDELGGLQELYLMDFYQRITKIKQWDLEQMLQKLAIDTQEKDEYYQKTKKNANEYIYKWSKLPQVKNVVFFGSVVATVVDKRLSEYFR